MDEREKTGTTSKTGHAGAGGSASDTSASDISASDDETAPGFSRFTRHVARAVGLAAVVVVLLLFFWTIARVVLLLFAGVLLAVLLGGLAHRLRAHTPLSYGWSLLVVAVGLIVLPGAMTGLILAGVAIRRDSPRMDSGSPGSRAWLTPQPAL